MLRSNSCSRVQVVALKGAAHRHGRGSLNDGLLNNWLWFYDNSWLNLSSNDSLLDRILHNNLRLDARLYANLSKMEEDDLTKLDSINLVFVHEVELHALRRPVDFRERDHVPLLQTKGERPKCDLVPATIKRVEHGDAH